MAGHDIIVIGASAGGVEALRALIGALPPDLPAAVFVVIHISPGVKSFLPTMLSNAGVLPARHATDGEAIEPGRIYVAPPDRHMVLRDGHVHLSAGPKENRTRPAVNPLFRSAAAAYGPRVIGVVLSGALDDGTAGMLSIERAGGIAVVQDPDEALFPSMPRSVIRYVDIDHVVSVANMPELLERLVSQPAAQAPARDPSPQGENRMETTGSGDSPGAPSGVTCPECRGVLWEERDGELMEFRCRIGHRFSTESLMAEQDSEAEAALASTLRSFEERASLAHTLAGRARERRMPRPEVERYSRQAREADELAAQIRRMLHGGLGDERNRAGQTGWT
jgi:two-component system chemotaxis response regulator CheB